MVAAVSDSVADVGRAVRHSISTAKKTDRTLRAYFLMVCKPLSYMSFFSMEQNTIKHNKLQWVNVTVMDIAP